MQGKNKLDARECVNESILDAITAITQILTATKAETLKNTIEDMTVTIPSMVNIPAETNLKALQQTIKNMANKAKVEALQHTIEHMAHHTVDITTILPTTDVGELNQALKNTASSIDSITKVFLELDWDHFEPTDADVIEAREILNSPNIEEIITDGLHVKQTGNELTSAHKTVVLDLMLLYHTIIFISDAATLTSIETSN